MKQDDAEAPYKVGYVESSEYAIICTHCKRSILKNDLRLAVMSATPMTHLTGYRAPNWYHFVCFFDTERPKSVTDFSCFQLLRWEDQERIKKKIAHLSNPSSSSSAVDYGFVGNSSSSSNTSVYPTSSTATVQAINAPAYPTYRTTSSTATVQATNAPGYYTYMAPSSSTATFQAASAPAYSHYPTPSSTAISALAYPPYPTTSSTAIVQATNTSSAPAYPAYTTTSSAATVQATINTTSAPAYSVYTTTSSTTTVQASSAPAYSGYTTTSSTATIPASDTSAARLANNASSSRVPSHHPFIRLLSVLERNKQSAATPKTSTSNILALSNYTPAPPTSFTSQLSIDTAATFAPPSSTNGFVNVAAATSIPPLPANVTALPNNNSLCVPANGSSSQFQPQNAVAPPGLFRLLSTRPVSPVNSGASTASMNDKIQRLARLAHIRTQARRRALSLYAPQQLDPAYQSLASSSGVASASGTQSATTAVSPFVYLPSQSAATPPTNPPSRKRARRGATVLLPTPSDAAFIPDSSRFVFQLNNTTASTVGLQVKEDAAVDPQCQRAQNARVYRDPCDNVYNAVLMRTDWESETNEFYKMQILESAMPRIEYWLFQAKGEIGGVGHLHDERSMNLSTAITEFEKVFYEQTGNLWRDRHSFKRVPGKKIMLDVVYKPNVIVDESVAPSQLVGPVQKFIKLIHQFGTTAREMESLGIQTLDLEKWPLGKISDRQIQEAYGILLRLEDCVTNAKLERTDDELKTIIRCTNEYYSLIPRDFQTEKPRLLNTLPAIQRETEKLDSMMMTEKQYSLIDAYYEKLNCKLRPLGTEEVQYEIVKTSLINTSSTNSNQPRILEIFEVERVGEDARYTPFKHLKNRKMLWHGSKLVNFSKILAQGLCIAPAGVSHTGHCFGRGIYFSDMVAKASNYCDAYSTTSNTGLLLLCEVALGNMKCIPRAGMNASGPSPEYDSVKAVGMTIPDPQMNMTLEDGIEIALGRGITASLDSQIALIYNEYPLKSLYCGLYFAGTLRQYLRSYASSKLMQCLGHDPVFADHDTKPIVPATLHFSATRTYAKILDVGKLKERFDSVRKEFNIATLITRRDLGELNRLKFIRRVSFEFPPLPINM